MPPGRRMKRKIYKLTVTQMTDGILRAELCACPNEIREDLGYPGLAAQDFEPFPPDAMWITEGMSLEVAAYRMARLAQLPEGVREFPELAVLDWMGIGADEYHALRKLQQTLDQHSPVEWQYTLEAHETESGRLYSLTVESAGERRTITGPSPAHIL